MSERRGVLLYDHSGHNFTYELACSLADQGHPMAYAYTAGVPSPHGRLADTTSLTVHGLCKRLVFERYRLPQRVWGELRLGLAAARLAGRERCAHVITCNMPVIIVAILAAFCWMTRRRFTVWFQDSQAGIAAALVDSGLALKAARGLEGWGLRRAERVVAISSAMVNEAKAMGVKEERIHLLPNWAPISKIPSLPKANWWSKANGLSDTFVFLYSGTLGLKHSPDRLSSLARWIKAGDLDAVVLVVSEGPVADALSDEANKAELPLRVMPFQPADVLPQVLAAADVCIVLLEAHASEFSVPSKVWSYMCAGRPILGCMPTGNAASRAIESEANAGFVVDPTLPASHLLKAADSLRSSHPLRQQLGRNARAFALQNFGSEATTDAFVAATAMRGIPQLNGASSAKVVEWRPGGHRLAYVAAIAEVAAEQGMAIELLTTRGVAESDEFTTHLDKMHSSGKLVVTIKNSLEDPRGPLQLLRSARSDGDLYILPEADRLLPALVLSQLRRELPRNLAIIVMRPPAARLPGRVTHVLGQLAKAVALLVATIGSRSINVLLLEDPLSEGPTRTWRWPFNSPAMRLDDPADLVPSEPSTLPPELLSLRPDTPVISVVGSIDVRKDVPLIVREWQSLPAKQGHLVIAGRQSDVVRRWLGDSGSLADPTIIVVDRYLSNQELSGVVKRSTALMVLQDQGISSGTLIAAAAIGRWVVTRKGTRTDAVARRIGLVPGAGIDTERVAVSMSEALSAGGSPEPRSLPTRQDFGQRVLSQCLASPTPASQSNGSRRG